MIFPLQYRIFRQLQMQLPLLLQKLLHCLLRLSKRLKVTKFRRNFHLKVLKFLLPEDLTHMSPLDQNHLRYSLGHVTGFVHIGAVTQGRLRRISSSSCDKSDAVSNSYVLLLEAINYYCCYCQKLSNRGEQPNSLSTKQPGRGCWPAGGARQNIPQR